MPKILTFLVDVSCALAQGTTTPVSMEPLTTTPYVANQTPSPSTFHSTPSPVPSSMPSQAINDQETYKFYGPDGNVCIHMRAGLEVKVNYTTENGTNSTSLDQLSPHLMVDTSASMCNTTYARLVLVYTVNHHFNFTFTFNDTTNNVTWRDGNTTFQYEPTGM